MKVLLVAPLEKEYYTGYYLEDALQALGCEWKAFDYRMSAAQVGIETMNHVVQNIIGGFEPDLILVLKGELISPDLIRKQKAVTALWYLDYEKPVWMATSAPAYKYFFLVCKGQVADAGSNAHWLPEAYCDFRFKPVEPEPLPEPVSNLTAFGKYGSDLAFIGTDKKRPMDILQRVAQACYDFKMPLNVSLKIWGAQVSDGWKTGHLERYWMGYRTTDEEFNKICASSKIILGVSAEEKRNTGLCFSARVYQTLGARGFLLEERSKGIEEMFTDQKDLVLWEGEDDLISKVKYYLNHEDERRSIASQGYENARKNHTFKQRMETLFKVTGLWT